MQSKVFVDLDQMIIIEEGGNAVINSFIHLEYWASFGNKKLDGKLVGEVGFLEQIKKVIWGWNFVEFFILEIGNEIGLKTWNRNLILREDYKDDIWGS